MIIPDADLVNRLERSAAALTTELVESLRRRDPGGPAATQTFHEGVLVSTGTGAYINRAVGIGDAEVTGDEVDRLEEFFVSRGLPPSIELSSWASGSLVDQVRARGYRADWFRNAYVRHAAPDAHGEQEAVPVEIRTVDESLLATWLDVLYAGVTEKSRSARMVSDAFASARWALPSSESFLALIDGEPAGCGTLERHAGIGWCGAAATRPSFRQRGVQAALLRQRLDRAMVMGCELIAATAVPTGPSARNLVRHGFSLVFTQLVVTRPLPSDGTS